MKKIKNVLLVISLLGIFTLSLSAYEGIEKTTMSYREYKDYSSTSTAESLLRSIGNVPDACVGIQDSEWVCQLTHSDTESIKSLKINPSYFVHHKHAQHSPTTNSFYDVK